ncbi:hypothetical protein FE839_05715 [Klebsiella indica]|uniref:O-antigen ligase family protein n=1 Tax=Klebsiella indica TaxID=2582917 RepID=A0A5R9LKY1_9ENTR|nr:hypothetical protein [Klebsiella indica]TLV21530.1 hypothetical protein FE839_05715 [Klebsiella indica]
MAFQQRNISTNIARFTFIVYLTWSILYAPLKWIFNLAGVGFLFYLPKILLLFVVFLYLFLSAKTNKPTLFLIFMIIISSIVSYITMRNMEQILFSVYIFIPFIFSIYFGNELLNSASKKYFLFLWIMCCLGLLLNIFITFPWAGTSVDIGGKEVYVAKEWATYGVSRYAGFSVASWSVASQLLALGTYLYCFTERKFYKFLYFIVTLLFLLLTTAKGPIFAFLIMGVVTAISNGKRYLIKYFYLPPLIIGIGLPLLSYIYWGMFVYSGHTSGSWLFTAETIFARMTVTWPLALDFIINKGSYLFGIGMGGIGSPLGYFYNGSDYDVSEFSFADSFYVYTFAVFGLLGIISVILLVNRAKNMVWGNADSIFSSLLILELLYFGIVDAPYERDFFICFIGIALANLYKRSKRTMTKKERYER